MRILERLHGLAMRVQVPVVLAMVPVSVALHTAEVGAMVVATVATAGAGMLLRGSIRSVVEQVELATDAIAHGSYDHRIASARDDEFGRLAASIDRLAARLEQLEAARRQFLASVSHELRTPLTIIQGHAFTMARRSDDPLQAERLGLVQDEARRLAELVDDLVDTAALDAGSFALDVERHDLGRIAAGAVRRFVAAGRQRDVGVRLVGAVEPQPVDIDERRIEQLLANLLSNAVRHAAVGSRVEVIVGTAEGTPSIEVRNVGSRIEARHLGTIFEPFVQYGAQRGAAGLGLAIARGIVEAHGGSLRVRQDLERGIVAFVAALPPISDEPRSRNARTLRVARPALAT